MNYNLNKKQKEAFEKAKQCFQAANKHSVMEQFRLNTTENFSFYDGYQWTKAEIDELARRGRKPITKNMIKPYINHLSGLEIQSRLRVACRSHREDDDELEEGQMSSQQLASAVTHLLLAIQENEELPSKSSRMFKDAAICGIGWLNFYREQHTGQIKCEYLHPLDVLFDPNDLSPSLTNMSYVSRIRWVPEYEACDLWPKHKDYFQEMFSGDIDDGTETGELDHRQDGSIDLNAMGEYGRGGRIPVVETQYKEKRICYQGVDQNGEVFQSFDKDKAMAISGKGEDELDTFYGSAVIRTVFCRDRLLEFEPLDPMIPNLDDYTYIPLVWSRHTVTGRPIGLVDQLKDIQRERNFRETKAIFSLNSYNVIADSTAVPKGMTPDEFREEINRPDSVIFKSNPDANIDIQRHDPLVKGLVELLDRNDRDFQVVSGVHDEALGKETNAVSGVAIQARQVNSVKNQIFAFEALRQCKKRQARMILDLIQASGDTFVESHILNGEEKEIVLLNIVKPTADGKQVMMNDIRTMPLKVYIEEIPDYESPHQEMQVNLEKILANPNAAMILQSGRLLKYLGVRDGDKIADDLKEIFQPQVMPDGQPQGQPEVAALDPQQPNGN